MKLFDNIKKSDMFVSDSGYYNYLAYDNEENNNEYKSINNSHILKYNNKHLKYPFADKDSIHLTEDLDNIYTTYTNLENDELLIELCIYHINITGYKPFLEFMLYKSNDDNIIYFPNFTQKLSDYNIIENASLLLDNLFEGNEFVFKGKLIETVNMNNIKTANINNRIILIYELKEKDNTVKHIKNDDELIWGTVSEIFNFRKILFYLILQWRKS